MRDVSDESVHLVVTSPPYWQLKDYGNPRQIGFHDTYEEYINNLNLVWSECHRVLHKGCRLCVNIGDQFARSVYYGRYKVIPIRTEIIKFCESAGFDYMGAIIWRKVTTCNTTGGATVMGSFPYPRNGILKLDYEFILILKKHGRAPKVSAATKERSKLTQEEWNRFFSGHWQFPGERQDKHLAMFPEELPRRLIRMFTFIGDSVLDPFLGSGTTCLAAGNLDRNSIGYEINEEFLAVIKEKLGVLRPRLMDEALHEFVRQETLSIDFKDRIAELPYVFTDPLTLDKKADPKKLQFGSRIDGTSAKREDYFTVKDVISPHMVLLSNGLKVRLLGVKPRQEKWEEAVEYLRETTRGQKVFLKFDDVKYDADNTLVCYLYLRNRTFLNAQLVRRGLVDADEATEYSQKRRFLAVTGKR